MRNEHTCYVACSMTRPAIVDGAHQRASKLGFGLSCDDATGRLLAVLAAAVPEGGRILEIGTGTGAGTAWLVHGLGERTDVRIVSIESDVTVAEANASAPWPSYVELWAGDAMDLLAGLGTFDLVFPDAPAGKWTGLSKTLAALRPRGVLVVDDMSQKNPNRRSGTNTFSGREKGSCRIPS
jgi:predicted O-methyltransferase YrrM